jgi:hypothetical protein
MTCKHLVFLGLCGILLSQTPAHAAGNAATASPQERLETEIPEEASKVRVVGVQAPEQQDGKTSSSLGPGNNSQMAIGVQIPLSDPSQKPKRRSKLPKNQLVPLELKGNQ